jgi:hypothetical protein
MNTFYSRAAILISMLGFLFPSLALAALDTNLGYGSSGSQVIALQQFLVSQGFLSSDYISGNYYNATLSAVRNFQISQGISPANGYFGPLTRAQANAVAGGNSVASPASLSPAMPTSQSLTTSGNSASASTVSTLTAQVQGLTTQVNTLNTQVAQLQQQAQSAGLNTTNSTSNTTSGSQTTSGNYDAAISSLNTQIQQLQAQVSTIGSNSNTAGSNTSTSVTTSGSSPWVYGSNGTDVRLAKNGNVGINTAAPTQPLDVRSNVRVATSDFVPSSTGTFVDVGPGAGTGNTYAKIQGYSNGGINPANIALNPVSGNVGIGTTNPHSLLDVAGQVSINPSPNSAGLVIQQSAPTSATVPGQYNFNLINTAFNSKVAGNDNSGGTGCACVTAFQVTMSTGGPNLAAREIYGGSFGVVHLTPDTSNSDKVGLASGVYSNASSNGMVYGGSQGATIDSNGSSPAMLGDEIDMVLNGSTPYRSGLNIINMGTKVASKVDAAFSVENSGAAGAGSGAFKKLIALTTMGGTLPQSLAADADFFYAETPMTVANIFNLPNVTVTGNIFKFPNFVVTGAGNVGIGTVTPDATLQVNGAAHVTGSIGIGVEASHQLQLSADDAVKPGGGSWANSSDARLKTNVQPIGDALSKISQLQGVTYDWINPSLHGGAAQSGGFIAQNVAKMFPDFVHEAPCAGADCSLVGGSTSSQEYTLSLPFTFDAYVVEAIKEIASLSEPFKQTLIAWLGDANNGIQKLCISKSDGTHVCVTGDQLAALLADQTTRKTQ